MAFVRDLVSVLMVCISYQAVVAYPRGAEHSLLEQYRTNGGAATAQSFSKLSKSCQFAAGSLLSGEFGTCADLVGLVSILETKESIISPINVKLGDRRMFKFTCDQADLAAASRVIRKGCATDLEEQSVAAVALYSIITHYNATSGKITRADMAIVTVSKEAYCTDCAHAIVSQSAAMIDAIKKDPAGIKFEYAHDKHMHQASDVCGPSFEDRALPTNSADCRTQVEIGLINKRTRSFSLEYLSGTGSYERPIALNFV
ncbi:hypothetical protein H4Q26_013518 [Puccinia striiformis f. sp. tritici PST-130]|nr:hypothetical protein H4Q26_013518 [Puccinia striiformis f. sp. tritici PST-130]